MFRGRFDADSVVPVPRNCQRAVTPPLLLLWSRLTFVDESIRSMEPRSVKYIDLCCGIGSFHHAFREHGWTCIASCDIDPHARKCYETLYEQRPSADIADMDPDSLGRYDILCAGFPCQSFSSMGKRKGLDDPRGSVFLHVKKFLEATNRPKLVLLENVPGLLSHDGGKTIRRIETDIAACGYKLAKTVWCAADFGLPQNRKRLWIVALNERTPFDPNDILNVAHLLPPVVTLSDFLGVRVKRPAARTIRTSGRTNNWKDPKTWEWYEKSDDSGPVRLSMEDAFALQGFPRDHARILPGPKTQLYKRIGNTIPTVFPKTLARRIVELGIFGQNPQNSNISI